MDQTSLICLGAGGHARVVLDLVARLETYSVVGLVDRDPQREGAVVEDVRVAGDERVLPKFWAAGVRHFVNGVGSTGPGSPRVAVYERMLSQNWLPVTLVHPSAVVASSVRLGNGVTIFARAVVHAGTRVRDNVLVNTAAVVEHDCVLDDHVHVAPGAIVAGGVTVGVGSHVGLGAVVREGLHIGAGALIGAGAVVIRDVGDGECVVGNPARFLKQVQDV